MTAIEKASLNLIDYLMKFEMLDYVDSAVSKLKICMNDLICQLTSENCQYICCNVKFMQTHCKQRHE